MIWEVNIANGLLLVIRPLHIETESLEEFVLALPNSVQLNTCGVVTYGARTASSGTHTYWLKANNLADLALQLIAVGITD